MTHFSYGKGRAYCNPTLMQLLCTESIGLLAVLRFVYRYITYHCITLQTDKLLHFWDNITVVSHMKNHTRTKGTNPNNFTQQEWDIQMSIVKTIKSINTTVHTKHVYGHQDTRTRPNSMTDNTTNRKTTKPDKSKQLKLEANLNIRADELATQALTDIVQTTLAKNTFHYMPSAKEIQMDKNNVPIHEPYKTPTGMQMA
eukprot:4037404-Ditylum_brightwellii.AAC.1